MYQINISMYLKQPVSGDLRNEYGDIIGIYNQLDIFGSSLGASHNMHMTSVPAVDNSSYWRIVI